MTKEYWKIADLHRVLIQEKLYLHTHNVRCPQTVVLSTVVKPRRSPSSGGKAMVNGADTVTSASS